MRVRLFGLLGVRKRLCSQEKSEKFRFSGKPFLLHVTSHGTRVHRDLKIDDVQELPITILVIEDILG